MSLYWPEGEFVNSRSVFLWLEPVLADGAAGRFWGRRYGCRRYRGLQWDLQQSGRPLQLSIFPTKQVAQVGVTVEVGERRGWKAVAGPGGKCQKEAI